MPILLILIVLVIAAGIDWYILRAIDKRRSPRWAHMAQVSTAAALLLSLLVIFVWPKKTISDLALRSIMWILYAWVSVYVAKLVFLIVDACGYLPSVCRNLWARIRKKASIPAVRHSTIACITGIVLGVIAFGLMWWGAIFNRYNLQVNEVEIPVEGLPESFDGLRIVQISDLHVGTYGNDTTFVHEVVERINSLKPDVVFFTGDIVNRNTAELVPFVSVLSRIKAPMGVYSILGNHDYGDYAEWPSRNAKEENQAGLIEMQRRMGWRLLLNETVTLKRDNDSIQIIGVENVGDPPFKVYGSLEKACPDLSSPTFKILLTHNPVHWADSIADKADANVALTLSGHTHAMQTEIFGLSPAAWRYKQWGGLYEDGRGRNLYVNIGVGTVGIPARIGATPEITLITLKSKH